MKKKRSSVCSLLVLGALMALMASCNYNHMKKESGSAPAGMEKIKAQPMTSLDFQSVRAAVLTPSCLQCHSSAGGNKGGLSLETYQQVRAQLNRIYYRSVEKKDMPAEGLPSFQLELLKNWIESGAPERGLGRGTGRPIQGPLTWLVIKNQVLKSSCLDCHSGENADAGLDFESLETVRGNIEKIFESAIIKQTMPLEPYGAMTEFEKQALMKWISQGMPE